jgi:hypothetical protein
MRIVRKPTVNRIGEKRIKKFFAFFPVTIERETRWWEQVEVEQEMKEYFDEFSQLAWCNIRFIN